MADIAELSRQMETRGYAIARSVVDRTLLDWFNKTMSGSAIQFERKRGGSVYGIRYLLATIPQLRTVLSASPFLEIARSVLGPTVHPVKATFFDKTQDANWPVPWHQDVTITLAEYRDVAGFEMRPVKDGVVPATPPIAVSEKMLALRIHLDDAGPDHGALRVIPGSHCHGRLTPAQINEWIATSTAETVAVDAGDVMLMRPLLLHASSPCRSPSHRRVIHVEYSSIDLPDGLTWAG